jgi:hypothetical protein
LALNVKRFWKALEDKQVKIFVIACADMSLHVSNEELKNLTSLDDGSTAVFIQEETELDDHRVYYVDVAHVHRITVIYHNKGVK